MHLIPPHDRKLKWNIRFVNHDGRTVTVAGDRQEDVARRISVRIDMLVRSKQVGDPPPAELRAWIDNMPESLSKRLVGLGLLLPRHVERHKSLTEWLDQWTQVVQGRNPNARKHPPQQKRKLRRLIESMNAIRIADLDPDGVTEAINSFKTLGCKKPTPLSTATRRSYFTAAKDFAAWLSWKLKVENPLRELSMPGAAEDIQYERMPLTVAQFRLLTTYLGKFERYPNQKSRWTAYDRKMIYWTAAKTGYRECELGKLRKWNLYLDEQPAVIGLKARETKNKSKGEVPIPNDLAAALKAYVAELEPDDSVFPFPATSGSVVDMLRRDLEGAGIPWQSPGGEIIDFHSFRHTAISWWLDVDRLSPKRVQVLARLKTLALVQNYSRNLRIEDFEWLNNGPTLVTAEVKAASA